MAVGYQIINLKINKIKKKNKKKKQKNISKNIKKTNKQQINNKTKIKK